MANHHRWYLHLEFIFDFTVNHGEEEIWADNLCVLTDSWDNRGFVGFHGTKFYIGRNSCLLNPLLHRLFFVCSLFLLLDFNLRANGLKVWSLHVNLKCGQKKLHLRSSFLFTHCGNIILYLRDQIFLLTRIGSNHKFNSHIVSRYNIYHSKVWFCEYDFLFESHVANAVVVHKIKNWESTHNRRYWSKVFVTVDLNVDALAEECFFNIRIQFSRRYKVCPFGFNFVET